MIDVIDYRAGNAPSVVYALEHLGIPCRLVSAPDDIAQSERLILPGVGAARATLASLADQGLVGALGYQVCSARVPFLGICIGLQVLFEHSEEGPAECLGWLPGGVRRFPDTDRVPQIGWNEVRVTRDHPLVTGWPADPYCYFVNSYHAVPDDPAAVLATTEYSVPFCSMVAAGNVAATQFHAEKSGALGLSLLRAFADWNGTC